MAPNFLSKLVKPSSKDRSSVRERVSSESSRPSGFSLSLRNRSQSTSVGSGGSNAVNSPSTPTQASISNSKKRTNHSGDTRIPSIVTTLAANGSDSHVGERKSLDSITTVSTQPHVTIVPPSPCPHNAELDSDSDEDKQPALPPITVGKEPSSAEEPEDLATPTPTPTLPKQNQQPTASPAEPPMSTSLAPGTYQVRKQSSNKSINSKKAPPTEINTSAANGNGHVKAATAPAEVAPAENGAVTTKPIVESPTDLKFPNPKPDPKPVAPAPQTNGPAITVQRENTVMSLAAAAGETKSGKKPWQRSATRKPTGLASAIAASGLAMANPAAQVSPTPLAAPQPSAGSSKSSNGAPGSPPYLSRSPAQSSVSQKSHGKTRSADLSPRSNKSRKSNTGASSGRPRRTSAATSAKSDGGSEYYASPSQAGTTTTFGDDARPDYYSGLDDSDDDGSSGTDDSDLDLAEEDIPVTGFAVASNKRNADFHELFPTVPEGDYLIEDYGCALQREILIQGRIYISENHICFHANIFGWITDLSIPIYEITSLEKKMTAFVIPNAIQITTRQAKYTFASFLSRDTTFDVIYNIWRLARPEDGASLVSSGRGSLDGPVSTLASSGVGPLAVALPIRGAGAAPVRKATQCTCGRENKHYTESAMDVVIPGTPENIHNLMFASGFIKDFMSGDQKLLDIQMSDWSPITPGSKLLQRNFSYIKPLSGSLGPKQTKCELKDEVVYSDFDDYISTMTTTRTPDVPSGGVFSVKTRTCITWASPVSSRVVVTTQVEWTGRSFIKGIIERSAIDGQKVYHADLEKAMRAYIQEHQSEFLPEGVDVAAVTLNEVAPEPERALELAVDGSEVKHPTEEEQKQRERERNARSLQWAWDTFDEACQVAKRSTKGALELIRDAWDQSESTTILWFLIVILVISNLWTLMRMGSGREAASRKLEARKVEDREKWVQSIVTALWDELAAGKREAAILADNVLLHGAHSLSSETAIASSPPVPSPESPVQHMSPPSAIADSPPGSPGWKEEVQQLQQTLDLVEQRVKAIRESLSGLEKLDALD